MDAWVICSFWIMIVFTQVKHFFPWRKDMLTSKIYLSDLMLWNKSKHKLC